MNQEQLQDAETGEQERGFDGPPPETATIDLDAAFESDDFKKRFQSAVDSEVRARIDKWKARQEKQAKQSEPVGEDGMPELDARIQQMIDQRIRMEREEARISAQAAKRAARFGIDLDDGDFDNLSPAQKLAVVDALEAKVPDIARRANGGADFNAPKQPRDPDPLTQAELTFARSMGISPDNYRKQKQALADLRTHGDAEPAERKS